MSNDRYISVIIIGQGRNLSFNYDQVLLQVVIGLGRNLFIVVYLIVIGCGRNRPIMTTTDILMVEVELRLRPSIILGRNCSRS